MIDLPEIEYKGETRKAEINNQPIIAKDLFHLETY